jgi:peptidoglycan hydrolase-like protein with peptidoglycan-binding domain
MSHRKRFWVTAVAVVAVSGGGWFLVRGHQADASAESVAAAPAVQTADVVRTDISTRSPAPGKIGYGAARPLRLSRSGLLTWLPASGTTISRDGQVCRVNDRPVLLLYGSLPLFRVLDQVGMVGRDVRVIVDNLRALGYPVGHQPGPGAVVTQTSTPSATSAAGSVPPAVITRTTVHAGDSVLTVQVVRAIKAWQRDHNLPETGHLAPGDVIVRTGAVRVASVSALPGDSLDGDLMTVTATTKVISVLVDAGDANSVKRGDQVTVDLPDGSKKPGRVTAISTSTQAADGADPNSAPKVDVTVTLTGPGAAKRIDSADVEVEFLSETHKGVLAVPVGALLALSEGGYAVQVSGAGLIPVKTGLIADGMAEVSGSGLRAGLTVVTTS